MLDTTRTPFVAGWSLFLNLIQIRRVTKRSQTGQNRCLPAGTALAEKSSNSIAVTTPVNQKQISTVDEYLLGSMGLLFSIAVRMICLSATPLRCPIRFDSHC